jgi:hypothetical protein
MIQTVVGSHPQVAMPPGDFPFAERVSAGLTVGQILEQLHTRPTWKYWKIRDFEIHHDQQPGQAFRGILEQYAAGLGNDIAGAKAPFSEFFLEMYDDWLADAESKFVYVLRNPFDVMASLKHSHIHPQWKVFTDLIEVQARNWLRSVAIALGRHHAQRENFFIVRYEDFITEPVRLGSALCEFLGVDFEEQAMLNRVDYAHHDTNTSFPARFAEREDKSTYIYRTNSRKDTLSQKEISAISSICGELATSLGYHDRDLKSRIPEQMTRVGALTKMRRLPQRVLKKFFN